jgi:flagellar motor protein MotB
MPREGTFVGCSGFVAGEVDFPALFDRQPLVTQEQIIRLVVDRCIQAEIVPDAGIFCSVVVIGHSDREDTPGLTSEQRRAKELESSQSRADSALEWLFTQLFDALEGADATAPVDWPSAQNVAVATLASGAADLVNKVPGLDEELRRQNRRVVFMTKSFSPE